MFPGIGGLNPKKMQAVMKQMGISQEEINASRVIIEKQDNTKIIINNPSITKIKIQGQENFQISGEISEESIISQEDIEMVSKETNSSKEEAKKALEKFQGDIAEAIISLKE